MTKKTQALQSDGSPCNCGSQSMAREQESDRVWFTLPLVELELVQVGLMALELAILCKELAQNPVSIKNVQTVWGRFIDSFINVLLQV